MQPLNINGRNTTAHSIDIYTIIPILPLYLINELGAHLTYRDLWNMSLVNKEFYVFIRRGIVNINQLNAADCSIGTTILSSNPIAAFSRLQTLNISENFLDRFSFLPLVKLPFLKKLDISGNRAQLPTEGLLAKLTGLDTLIISNNFLYLSHLTQIMALSKLSHLEIAFNRASTLLPFGSLDFMTTLKTLNLSGNYIRSATLTRLSTLPILATLDLSLSILEHNTRHFLSFLTSLNSLNISATGLRTDFPTLSSLTKLESLDISYNQLNDNGLIALGIPFSVRKLNAKQSLLTDLSLEYLLQLKRLVQVSLEGNAITQLALEEFNDNKFHQENGLKRKR